MKKFIEELTNKKELQHTKLMLGNITIQNYLSNLKEIDKEIEIVNKAITWLNTPESNQKPVIKRKFNWLKFSVIALLIFILETIVLIFERVVLIVVIFVSKSELK